MEARGESVPPRLTASPPQPPRSQRTRCPSSLRSRLKVMDRIYRGRYKEPQRVAPTLCLLPTPTPVPDLCVSP